MAFFGRVAYRDPAWNVWLNYLDVQDNFNAEVGFVQRTRHPARPRPTSARRRGPARRRIRMLEPMYVLTYITDQHNRLVDRHASLHDRHLRCEDDSFINVIYQRNLDVLDVPFRIQPERDDSGRHLQRSTSGRSPTTPTRRRRFYERFTCQPMEFYGGTQADRVRRGRRARARASCRASCSTAATTSKMPWGDFLANLAILRVDYTVLAAHDDPQPDAVQLADARSHEQHPLQLHLPSRQRSSTSSTTICQQTGTAGGYFGRKDRQLVVKATYLLQRY